MVAEKLDQEGRPEISLRQKDFESFHSLFNP
jgi:hypothetical protein